MSTVAPETHPVAQAVRASFSDGTVLAAVSGGADSMAMFHALCEFARERPGLRVVAAHFDHQLRADSARDRDRVDAIAGACRVRVMTGAGDVAAHAHATRQSIEAAARELRYAFLERAADEAGAAVIATAHTRSDHIETILMRIVRGAGSRGLRGIPCRRGRIVRPLLDVDRADTRDYCESRGMAVVVDPGNTDRRFFRNRIRHDVLPALRCVYPGLDATLERLAASAEAEFERAGRATDGRLAAFLRADASGAWVLALDAFADLDDEDRAHMLSAALDMMDMQEDVSRVHYRMLGDLAHHATRPGKAFDLPGMNVRRDHDALVFLPRGRREPECVTSTLPVPGSIMFGDWEIRSARVAANGRPPGRATECEGANGEPAAGCWPTGPARATGAETGHAPLTCQVPREPRLVVCVSHGADAPIIVRAPHPGDRMQPFGMSGHKKLSDLFIDKKVPRRLRARTPVIEIANEIIWLVGVAAGESTRVSNAAEGVIQLSATRLAPGEA